MPHLRFGLFALNFTSPPSRFYLKESSRLRVRSEPAFSPACAAQLVCRRAVGRSDSQTAPAPWLMGASLPAEGTDSMGSEPCGIPNCQLLSRSGFSRGTEPVVLYLRELTRGIVEVATPEMCSQASRLDTPKSTGRISSPGHPSFLLVRSLVGWVKPIHII